MKSSRALLYGLLAVLVMAASAWMTRFNDDGLGTTWTHHVLHNWDEAGFFRLHGQMIYNPGGHGVETDPMICTSHRAASLYPVFVCHQLLGGQPGVYLYYALLAGMVLWSIWRLLGGTEAAFWLGAVAVLTPGFVRWQTSLDPNLAAAVFGFPYCVAVLALLRQPAWRWPQVILLGVLIMVFSAVNWTTAFVHGMVVAFMLALPVIPWRRMFVYIGLGAFCAGIVLAISLAAKLDPSKGGGLAKTLAGYGWGDAGYGSGMATSTALLRIGFTNLAGLLPVWLFLVWRSRWPGISSGVLLSFFPLASALGALLFLRNYAGHHPWMTCHFILLGLILSAALLKMRLPVRSSFSSVKGGLWLAAALAYGCALMAIGHEHNARGLTVIRFIRDHTPRAATLVAAQERDPELTVLLSRLEMDRSYLIAPTVAEAESGGTNRFIITEVKPSSSVHLVAHLDARESGNAWMKQALAWYSRVIAHRRAGDKVEVEGTDFYLYQP